VGPQPIVSQKETGAFPPEFQVKYDALKTKWDQFARSTNDFVNSLGSGAKQGDMAKMGSAPKFSGFGKGNDKDFNLTSVVEGIYASFRQGDKTADFFKKHEQDSKDMPKEIEALRQEGIKLGLLQQ
jgi:hypothetical protein